MEDRLNRIEQILEEVAQRQRLFAEEMRQLRASQEKTDEQLKKTDEQLKKTDEQLKKTSKEVAGIGGGLGRVAEGLTAPSVPKVFKKLGIKVEAVHQRVKAFHNGKVKDEIDFLCQAKKDDGSSLILVGEVKANLTSEDVQDFLDESLISFKENFTEYKEKDVIGFVAGLNVGEDTIRFAQKKGLYVLVPYGQTMRLANPPNFKPKVW